jgi:septum site-determining protein MinD
LNDGAGDHNMEKKIITIHSSRGGTGKTTIATNLAVIFARQGLNTAILDLDFRAPSLFGVFSKGIQKPIKYWLNDFFLDRCSFDKVLIDVSAEYSLNKKLLVGLANPAIMEIKNMMGKSRSWEVAAAKKLFSIRPTVFDKMNMDCCILDTSPGIQYSSINAVASADVTVIVTTLDHMDVEGVKNMLIEFYDELEKKSVILMNKVFPQTRMWSDKKRDELVTKLEKAFKSTIIGVIPCYCDILQTRKNLFSIVENAHHPFLQDLWEAFKKLEKM